MRIGVGVDIHQLRTGQVMYLAGLSWPDEPAGLAGHSDGDVAAHACADALYSAAGLGDLGSNIGVDDPEVAGRRGGQILAGASAVVRAAGFEIANVSVQVIGNSPRIASRRAEAEAVLSAAAGAPVSVSGTTADGLGLTGRGEGIAAVASALIWLPLPGA
jgi:2-C-methyl-D-erythritol 2,4-cyclodiphosphate synthase